MRNALIRLEDVGPGGPYNSTESLKKLRIIADYLKSERVPFHISLIPHFIDPPAGHSKSIDMLDDPYVRLFNDTINYMDQCSSGRTVGMHGYTHQFSNSISAIGDEFFSAECTENCPPDDSPDALSDRITFMNSYASSRMKAGYECFKKSDITLSWGLSTPHYTASNIQREIMEAWAGIFYENNPWTNDFKRISIIDRDSPFYRGVIYIPTPLYYVDGMRAEETIAGIIDALDGYGEGELASFFYHPFLEFSFIELAGSGCTYAENSYLKRLIRAFKERGFTFVSMINLVDFVPSTRKTNFFPGIDKQVMTGSFRDAAESGLVIWSAVNGTWHYCPCLLENFPNRQTDKISFGDVLMLSNWAVGNGWKPFTGDFDGDGIDDVVVWDPEQGEWQVALSDTEKLIPHPGTGDYIWLKNWARGQVWHPFIGDFDGDGKADLLVWYPPEGEWQVALSTGNGFVPAPGSGNYIWLKPWAKGEEWVPLIGDFNGDGRDDIVVWNPSTGEWQVAFSEGDRFVPAPQNGDAIWLRNWGVGPGWTPLTGDFDGDGISDILVVNCLLGDWQAALTRNHKFIPTGNALYPWAADVNMQPFAVDLNKDGKFALLARHPFLRNGTVDVAVSVIEKES